MRMIATIKDVKAEVKKAKQEGKSIGFVPTMGFLHEGHLSLIKKAREENDFVVVSIFVNPIQFDVKEDLESYPRDLDRDCKLVEAAAVDVLFIPSMEALYPEGYSTYVEVTGDMTKQLCGKSRNGHFKGVTTVVLKLFNIITPDHAYFGQKDAQQVAVIKKMVEDMNMDVEIVPCDIVREKDGLALSSRNVLLQDKERQDATILSKSLLKAKEMIIKGERDAAKIRASIIENLYKIEKAQIDYVEVVNAKTLESIEKVKGEILIAVAVKIGKPRLIDNIQMHIS
ncbi:pantoate--beta-alanine ligase [Clostridiaceae bacterium 35-E11]